MSCKEEQQLWGAPLCILNSDNLEFKHKSLCFREKKKRKKEEEKNLMILLIVMDAVKLLYIMLLHFTFLVSSCHSSKTFDRTEPIGEQL